MHSVIYPNEIYTSAPGATDDMPRIEQSYDTATATAYPEGFPESTDLQPLMNTNNNTNRLLLGDSSTSQQKSYLSLEFG
jgi:hypothetical protein